MLPLVRAMIAIPLAAPLAACAGHAEPTRRSERLAIQVAEAPRASDCQVAFAGRRLLLFAEKAPLLAALREAARHTPTAIVLTDATRVTYRCFGGTLFTAQRAGFATVTFQSEPPGAEDAADSAP